MKSRLKVHLKFMASPYPVFWILPYFMFLIVLGTVEQKYIGLYDAVQTYIYAPLIWWGYIPLPGGGLILALLFLSLLLNFLFSHEWKIQKIGILLTHFGMLLLLIGGGITYLTKTEGFLIFQENETTNLFYDYHERILKISSEDDELIIPFTDLIENQVINIPFTDFSLQIIETCMNCDILPIEFAEERKGIAQKIKLSALPSKVNKEENFSGITFQLISSNKKTIGTFIALEDLKEFPVFKDIAIKLQRAENTLPFSLTLTDFKKIDHAGSMTAKSYESDITVSNSISNWSITVRMNKPLRHGGYTFYQSSFDQRQGTELSVLNVVKDKGRLFPYISSFIIALGLLIHCVMRYRQAKK